MTMKQKLLQDVGSIITSTRSNTGKFIMAKKGQARESGLTFEQYLDMKKMNEGISIVTEGLNSPSSHTRAYSKMSQGSPQYQQ